jgi:serine/threonine-protein kinase
MHPQYAESPDAAERLIREARAASRLSHPNVVDVYDVIRDDQTLFLVMELLQGESLRDFLRKQARHPVHELIAILLGAMSGVAAAHAQGVIHRDLKPDNIFLERIAGMPKPVAKVLDFGIAKLAELSDGRGATLTQTGTAIGTPVYMSFEQLRGDKSIDIRTDVYAFGVMLYEALVGHTPFTAATLSELAIKVATTDAVALKTLRPDAPTALCAIIDRAIRRNRDERWPDVPSLMQQLTPFAQPASFREHMSFRDMTAPRMADPQQRAIRAASTLEPADWAGTVAFPDTQPAAFLSVATSREASNDASDSLTARELADSDRPKTHILPVWVAAAALLAVAIIAALLLLGNPSETKPTSAARPLETSTSAASTAPPKAAPELPQQPSLQIEALVPTQPVEAAQPLDARPELPASDSRVEPAGTGSRRRRNAAVRSPVRELPQVEPHSVKPARLEPEPAKPKNATDLLGF